MVRYTLQIAILYVLYRYCKHDQPRINRVHICTERLILCILEIPKRVLSQKVKTQVKCRIMRHFVRFYTVKVENIFRQKSTISFENYNLAPLDINNGPSQV